MGLESKKARDQRAFIRAIKDLGIDATQERIQAYLGWKRWRFMHHLAIAQATVGVESATVYRVTNGRERSLIAEAHQEMQERSTINPWSGA